MCQRVFVCEVFYRRAAGSLERKCPLIRGRSLIKKPSRFLLFRWKSRHLQRLMLWRRIFQFKKGKKGESVRGGGERRGLERDGPHHRSDSLIIWYIVYQANGVGRSRLREAQNTPSRYIEKFSRDARTIRRRGARAAGSHEIYRTADNNYSLAPSDRLSLPDAFRPTISLLPRDFSAGCAASYSNCG